MALSGSYDFTQNRDEAIKDALLTAKIIRDDETPTGTMISSCARMLNRMLKAMTADGLQLWTHKNAVLFLEDGKKEYDLYSAGDRWVLEDELAETKLNGAHDASDTTLTVDSTTGMTAADVIGIETASNTMHWTTIVSVDSSTTLTITSGLAAAAADNAYVAAYTSKAQKPYRITEAYVVRYANEDTHIPLNIISKNEYHYLHQNTTEATPNTVMFAPWYDRGKLRVWPTPDADNHRIVFHAHFPFDDMDSATDNFSFPDYWLEAIHYNLAYRLRMDYKVTDPGDPYSTWMSNLKKLADSTYQKALDFDVENTYIQIEPEAEWLRK